MSRLRTLNQPPAWRLFPLKQISCLVGLALLVGCNRVQIVEFEKTQTITSKNGADPTVAFDSKTGLFYVAWAKQEADESKNVMLVSSTPTGGFTEPLQVNRVAGEVSTSSQFPPQVRVGSDGAVYVAWVGLEPMTDPPGDDKAPVIKVTHSNDGGHTFEPPVVLGIGTRKPVASLYFGMATGPDRAVYVTWLDLSRYAAQEEEAAKTTPAKESGPIDADFRFAKSSDGGRTFTTSPSIDANACMCCRTAVAAGTNGTAYLMWRHVFPVNERDVVVASASGPGAGAVSAPVRVHGDHWKLDGCPDRGPGIEVGPDGTIHVVWYTAAPGLEGLHYARSIDGGRTFGSPIPLNFGEAHTGSQASLTVANDTPWLVWEEPVSNGSRLRLARIVGGTTLEKDTAPVGSGDSPGIAAGGGRVATVWTENGAVKMRVAKPISK